MERIIVETLILSITSFIGTNIDDLFINMLLFSEAKNKAERNGVVIGKYLGIGTLMLLSILGASGLQFLPSRYIGYLGVVPICLGVKEIVGNFKREENATGSDNQSKATNRVMNTALITIANGADNIGVYVPLFAGFAAWQIVVAICVFLILIGVWCFLGKALAELPALQNALTRYKHIIVPVVYIALGMYILLKLR